MIELEKQIIELYLGGQSLRKTGKIVNKSPDIVRKILIKNNIDRRNKSESVALNLRNNITLNEYIIKIIEGELLGDGHINLGKYQSCFSYGSSKEEYVKYLSNIFKENNIPSVGVGVYTSNTFDKRYNKRYLKYHFSTISTLQLKEMRKKWYDENGIKIVPKDLILSKESILSWWIGDGSNNINRFYGWLETDAFTEKEVNFLSNSLNSVVGINSKVNKCKVENNKTVYRIYIPRVSLEIMLDFIGPCPVECYNYKWRRKPNKEEI